jgi:hypothetical protein
MVGTDPSTIGTDQNLSRVASVACSGINLPGAIGIDRVGGGRSSLTGSVGSNVA